MKKITEIFSQKAQTFSFELFPPKTPEGYENLLKTIEALSGLHPDFFSCTYGAGGGNRDKTFDICEHIQQTHGIPAVAHLTCVLNSRAQIRGILEDVRARGIRNILALRGDPPQDRPDWTPGPENFTYSYELCQFITEHFPGEFGIGVAGFPEGHILCRDLDQDAAYLKNKLNHGGDFVITQLCFDNSLYRGYVARLRALGVTARIIPGVLPVANFSTVLKFSARDGMSIPKRMRSIFEPIADDPSATLQAGITFAIEQCRDLLASGAPGIHFYTLNKYEPIRAILQALR